MDPGKIFQIITNSTLLATRLLSESGIVPLEFTQSHYCAVLREDAKVADAVLSVKAVHQEGAEIRYSISEGNSDGLFTIDQHSGVIALAATLDYESKKKHELSVSGESEGHTVHTLIQVRVADVNDNPPFFVSPDPKVTVVEEEDRHLPTVLLKVEASDRDSLDYQGLLYTVRGDGVDGYKPGEAYFSINSLTGELIQQRALDRDPPEGKTIWKVRVQVRDGQALWSRPRDKREVVTPNYLSSGTFSLPNVAERQKFPLSTWKILTERVDDDALGRKYKEERRSVGRERERSLGNREGKSIKGKQRLKGFPFRRTPDNPRKRRGGIASASSETRRVENVEKILQHREKRSNGQRMSPKGHFSDAERNERIIHSDKFPASHRGFRLITYTPGGAEETGRRSHQFSPKDIRQFLSAVEGNKPEDAPGARDCREADGRERSSDGEGEESGPSGGNVPDDATRSPDECKKSVSDHISGLRDKQMKIVKSDVKRRLGKIERNGSTSYLKRKEGTLTKELFDDQHHSEDMGSYLKRKDRTLIKEQFDDPYLTEVIGSYLRRNERTVTKELFGDPYHTEVIGSYLKRKDRTHTKDLFDDPYRTEVIGSYLKRKDRTLTKDLFDDSYHTEDLGIDGDCFTNESYDSKGRNVTKDPSNTDISAYGIGGRTGRVHLVETTVTIIVKDINDNPPIFINGSMFAEVQENGPIDLSVIKISALDADDPDEGRNARLRYSIEKNALQEKSGEPVFKVEPRTGLITTAVCCLDRETTPEYHIQVAATDGGGLRGNAIVFVRLVDVNDNSPRLAQRMWEADIDETWGADPPDNSTLLEISVNDRDVNNYFFFRVVEESGNGWDHFDIRTSGNVGHLYASQTLDFEDERHRKGFRFLIQVTDKGRGGWFDGRHLDSAWVKVRLKDLNDNAPSFPRSQVRVTVREDAGPGTVLAALPAFDLDMEGKQPVDYHVVGGWDALTVDETGVVSLWRALDREAPEGDLSIANVIAVDRGQPPLSSTATLTISVTDVNDCPPRLLQPTVFHVPEGVPPRRLGVLTATDEDVWALGNGPPFSFTLAPSNPAAVEEYIDIIFHESLDSGRGGAEVWTKDVLDREQHRILLAEILLKDSQGLSGNQTISIIVDDVNDNPMKPASKTVYLWKTQTGSSEAPLGRVYVDDPDDWDIADKRFHWLGQPHPLFSLDSKKGTILASSQVREGRYELQFTVDDKVWGQRDISANVSVVVRLLSQDALAHSAPIILSPTTPEGLTAGWTPMSGGGGLGRLINSISEILDNSIQSVEIVSIYDVTNATISPSLPSHFTSQKTSSEVIPPSSSTSSSSPSSSQHNVTVAQPEPTPATCVWISVLEKEGRYMNPVKMQGLLGLHSNRLEDATNLTIKVETKRAVLNRDINKAGWNSENEYHPEGKISPPMLVDLPDPSSAASRAPLSLPFKVVDTNSTSLVTPHLTQATHCGAQDSESCTPISCLNGGRCIRTLHGNRCVCPSGSWGFHCKILSRTFNGSGFVWIQPIPACIPTVISLRILTQKTEALILYAGPLTQYARYSTPTTTPLLALQIVQGEVQMLVEGGRSPMKLQVGMQVNDGNWHIIHVKLDKQGASLMVDFCDKRWENQSVYNSHCISMIHWRDPKDAEMWISASPIQLGGLAHSRPSARSHGWRESPISQALEGCLSQLVINGQLMDLGEPALSKTSVAGCVPQESSCSYGLDACGVRGTCVGGLNEPECQCDPGWSGNKCDHPTMAARFGSKSFMKMTLSFTPASKGISVQVRVRTWGRRSGLILRLGLQPVKDSFSLQLQEGVACASLTHRGRLLRSVCIEGYPVGDGQWHTLRAEFHGHNLIVRVDDGDGLRQNYSLPAIFESQSGDDWSYPDDSRVSLTVPRIDLSDGLSIGGIPEFQDETIIAVKEDLEDSCLDDLRISGQTVPLIPTLNKTSWVEVTRSEGVVSGCSATNACLSITCSSPLSCINNWGRPMCSCGPEHHLIGNVCEDINECLWQPCLHGGSCYNTDPGFLCVCGPSYSGEHCQWKKYNQSPHPLAGPAALAVITISLLFMVFVGVFLTLRLRRHWMERKLVTEGGRTMDGAEDLSTEEATIIEVKGGTEEGGGAEAGHTKMEPVQEILMENLHLHSPNIQTAHRSVEKNPSKPVSRRPSKASLLRAAAILGDQTASLGDAHPAKDDLRAYAYEGEGSSAGSLSSALSELKIEKPEEGLPPLAPAFLDVMDLLKTLPDATSGLNPDSVDQTEVIGPPQGGGLTSIGASPVKMSMQSTVSQVKPQTVPPLQVLQEGKKEEDIISTLC
ncbi:putative neural-cadherin 2 [Palaemon carinicauda]|uniref:putative neural-cadherin 2 n=1 Tax=Palaemon carinicauda TaxID=392227 RepID=UPI0035B5EE99